MVAINKILTGALLISSTIGNANSTHLNKIKVDYEFPNLEQNLEAVESLNYFAEVQPQSQVRLNSLSPIAYNGCTQACAETYSIATAACVLIAEPISQTACHALAAAVYAACLAACV